MSEILSKSVSVTLPNGIDLLYLTMDGAKEVAEKHSSHLQSRERKVIVSHLCHHIDSILERDAEEITEDAKHRLLDMQQHIVNRFPDIKE